MKARRRAMLRFELQNVKESQMEIKNAIITATRIDIADRGALQILLDLDYGGSGQGFGGWVLYVPRGFTDHRVDSRAGHFIFRVLEVAGVGQWDRLPGRSIRVRASRSKVEAIGHIVKDDWFAPADDFQAQI